MTEHPTPSVSEKMVDRILETPTPRVQASPSATFHKHTYRGAQYEDEDKLEHIGGAYVPGNRAMTFPHGSTIIASP